jgi:hypothetical protein
MGRAIPRQHPAVVLRSHFNHLRALLAVALIAVAGLAVAVVILANDADEVSDMSSAKPVASINYGDSKYVNPSTGYPAVPLSQLEHPTAIETKDEAPSASAIGQSNSSSATETKDEAPSAAAIGQSNDGTVTRGSKTDPHEPASLLP